MKKSFITALALVLVLGIAIGGTVAWLTDKTETIENTFTVGDIDISLTETWNTDTNNDGKADAWKALLVPGKEYTKDPKVTVDKDKTNVDIYLFVKFEESGTINGVLTYKSLLDSDNGWTQGTGTEEGGNGIPTNVWYREVKVGDDTKSWNLLEGDKVTVKDTLTKDTMPATNATPVLKYTAAAIQMDGSTSAADAWTKLPSAFTGATTTP